MLGEQAARIVKEGTLRIKVKRAGMLQFQIFNIRKVRAGQDEFVELWLDRVIDMSELERLANELELPVETQNGRAFPEGKGAKDFILD
ncbi:MAG TPA: hypothetical protein VND15_03745 [Candidatus Acidoferrales bacterium]|nr:hypothetical protein [Candidatus Acidoferrales bacterium]